MIVIFVDDIDIYIPFLWIPIIFPLYLHDIPIIRRGSCCATLVRSSNPGLPLATSPSASGVAVGCAGKFIRLVLRYTKRYGKPLVSLGHDPLFGGFSIFFCCCRVTTNRFCQWGNLKKKHFWGMPNLLIQKKSWQSLVEGNIAGSTPLLVGGFNMFQPFLFSIIYGIILPID